MLLELVVLQAQEAGRLVDPVLPGKGHGLGPQLPGQSPATLLPTAPLIELASCEGKGRWDIRGWSGTHQRFSRKSVPPACPGEPFHGLPIPSGLPATADNISSTKLFHAGPPKGHDWHREALDETESRLRAGQETMVGWPEAKKELRKRFE